MLKQPKQSAPRSVNARLIILQSRYARFSIYLCMIGVLIAQSLASQQMIDDYSAQTENTSYDYYYNGDVLVCTTSGDWNRDIECSNNETYKELKQDSGWMIVFDLTMVVLIVLFAGMMSGLTIGLLSLDITNLQIVIKSGDPDAQKHAKKILPLVKKHHLLLVTLLVCNAIAMETLPLFLDRVVGPLLAILISVTLVLLFGEIIPQALCTRYGLAIGAYLAWIVWILIVISFVVSYPLSKLLDCVLGDDSGTFYRRAELKELVHMHSEKDGNELEERLTQDEVSIIKGAIDLRSKTVASAMTPIERVSKLDFDDRIDHKTCERMVQEGHSRWPVYRGDENNIIGMLLVKSLIDLDPEEGVPVKDLPLRRLPVVNEQMPLYQVLNMFQLGRSHMAIVIDSIDCITTRGIITMEDIVEELIGKEILDETDVFTDVAKQIRVTKAFRNEMRRFSQGFASP